MFKNNHKIIYNQVKSIHRHTLLYLQNLYHRNIVYKRFKIYPRLFTKCKTKHLYNQPTKVDQLTISTLYLNNKKSANLYNTFSYIVLRRCVFYKDYMQCIYTKSSKLHCTIFSYYFVRKN